MSNHNDYNTLITDDVLTKAGVTRTTLIGWIKNYTVSGRPIGVKVGGRWRINATLLHFFLKYGGDQIR